MLLFALTLLAGWNGGAARAETGRFNLLRSACSATTDAAKAPSAATVRGLDYRCDSIRASGGEWLWLRMEAPPSAVTALGQWALLVNETRFEEAKLIVERASGELASVSLNRKDLTRGWLLGNLLRINLPAGDSPVRTIYLGVAGLPDNDLLQKADLATDAAVTGWTSEWLLMGGIFVGALTASLLYNLLLLGGVRHRLQFTYLAWISATLAYGLSWSSLIHFLIPGLAGADAARFTYCMSGMSLGLGVMFFIEFFREGQLPRWLIKAQTILAGMLMSFAVLGTFDRLGLFNLADAITGSLIIVTQMLTAYGIIRAIEREPGPAVLYGLGWSFPFVTVMLNILWGYSFMGPNIVADAGIFIAIVVQALLLSAATAVRLGGIRRERDRARAESERLRSLAETDPLTQLLNRRGLVHRAQAIMGMLKGSALLVLDVDYFKTINDSFGHDVGDRVLIRVGALLDSQCAGKHPVGRIGGEEFAIVLGEDDFDTALHFADRLRRQLAGANFADLLGDGRGVTVSIGLAVVPQSFPATFERLYIAADRALYAAKNAGRNRVEAASIEDVRRAEARLATVINGAV